MLCEQQLNSILLCWKRKKKMPWEKEKLRYLNFVLHINAFQFFPLLIKTTE